MLRTGLSKGGFFLVMLAKKKQSFDKLRTNGFFVCEVRG
jgi:hypothetical protein